jgi:hypothetical protein
MEKLSHLTPKKRRKDDGEDLDSARKEKARNFYQAIMADLGNVVESGGAQLVTGVMRNVPSHYLGTSTARNIVVREDDSAFWNAILGELAQEDTSNRVAVVGSPGIGKSTTVAFAIRLLLKQKKTVVYKYRTEDETGYYVQFTPPPTSTDEDGQMQDVGIEVYPEQTKSADIPSLLDPETYYVVDPGKTKTSCNPGPFVVCRVIIVASPDERHWGGSGFTKDEETALGGEIRYFPAWTLPQLEIASMQLSNVQFQAGEVAELFSIFGGVPRQVFAPKRKERNRKQLQTKVESITDQKLREIVTGQVNRHSGFGVDQPGGGVVEFRPTDSFQNVELNLASSSVLEWVRIRFMDSIWTSMAIYPSPISWQLLEDYMLHALQNANPYSVRACVGKQDATYNQFHVLNLGQCTGMTLRADCTAAVIGGPDRTVFYSSDKCHPLYDMIYKVGTIYHALQVTEGKSHKAKRNQITSLVNRLQIGIGGRELRLYFAVHEGVFDSFVTDPVTPVSVNGVSYYHLKLTQGLRA